jgi:hypothetical protein
VILIVFKNRDFTLASPIEPVVRTGDEKSTSREISSKRKPRPVSKGAKAPKTTNKRSKTQKARAAAVEAIDEEPLVISSDDEDTATSGTSTAPQRYLRNRKAARGPSNSDDEDYQPMSADDEEVVIKTEDPSDVVEFGSTALNDPDVNFDEEDTKLKPVLSLSYQNFELSGRCLCVIVEPWPAIRSVSRTSRAPSLAASLRGSSIAPPDFVSSNQMAARGRTPLFLPDDDDEAGQTPFRIPDFPQRKILPPVPAFDTPMPDDDDDNAELIQFSQALNTSGLHGEVDDDDEFDGAVLFADADEVREL